jgi:16S rRNA (adenine1518-N6/adenine1519-N6)-dimethyltransferase
LSGSETITHRDTLKPNKRLGQHFLKDRSVIAEIIERSGFLQSDDILEIGPGLGALTIPLAGYVNRIIAVEKDGRLFQALEKMLSRLGTTNVTLINDDILKVDLGRITGAARGKIKAIGNLPYNISSPFLEKLFKHRDLISLAVLMLQREFAERLLASPGGKDYGALTVLIRYDAKTSPLIDVSSDAFYPRPKVGSMVIRVDMERMHERRAEDDGFFRMVVKGAFAHRRKTILNSLGGTLLTCSNDEIKKALNICSIDPVRRAETLDIDEFISLADSLKRLERERNLNKILSNFEQD